MKKQWNYVEKDGNPKEPGTYWVTLIYPEWKDNKKLEECLRRSIPDILQILTRIQN